MQVHTFIADSAADAVAQIRAQLGPQAVVLDVRPLPTEGLARLWQRRRIEVLACLPAAPVAEPSSETIAELRQELSAIKQRVGGSEAKIASAAELAPVVNPAGVEPSLPDPNVAPPERPMAWGPSDGWRVASFLENGGLLPLHAQRVVEELRARHGEAAPVGFGQELDLTGALLCHYWHRLKAPGPVSSGTHVLVGAPGVGKTVCVCKWLAHTVLVESRSATVWRLDGRTANTAEALSVYGEILGVPVHRSVPAESTPGPGDLLLVDLPGVGWNDSTALNHLLQQLKQFPNPQVHLVVNAAYELPLLLAQVRAFSVLPVTDLIVTHLDEESRWGKLWNFVLGTNFPIRFLSAGQNIPGDWTRATPEQILARQFPRK